MEMHKKVYGEFVAGCTEGKTILLTRARVVLDRSSFLYKILCGKLPSYSGNWIVPQVRSPLKKQTALFSRNNHFYG